MKEAIKRIQKSEYILWFICGTIFVFTITQYTQPSENKNLIKNASDQVKVLKWLVSQSYDSVLNTVQIKDTYEFPETNLPTSFKNVEIPLPDSLPKKIKKMPVDTNLLGLKSYFEENPYANRFEPDPSISANIYTLLNSWLDDGFERIVEEFTINFVDFSAGYKINIVGKYRFKGASTDFRIDSLITNIPGIYTEIENSSVSAVELTNLLLSKLPESLKDSASPFYEEGERQKIFPALDPFWSQIKELRLDEAQFLLTRMYQDEIDMINIYGFKFKNAKSVLIFSPVSIFIILFFILANLNYITKNFEDGKEKIKMMLDEQSWPLKLSGFEFIWLSFLAFPIISLGLLFLYYYEHRVHSAYWVGLLISLFTIIIGIIATQKTKFLINKSAT